MRAATSGCCWAAPLPRAASLCQVAVKKMALTGRKKGLDYYSSGAEDEVLPRRQQCTPTAAPAHSRPQSLPAAALARGARTGWPRRRLRLWRRQQKRVSVAVFFCGRFCRQVTLRENHNAFHRIMLRCVRRHRPPPLPPPPPPPPPLPPLLAENAMRMIC